MGEGRSEWKRGRGRRGRRGGRERGRRRRKGGAWGYRGIKKKRREDIYIYTERYINKGI